MGSVWAMKELVANNAAGTLVQNLEGKLHEDGTPVIVWNVQSDMSGMTMFTTNLVQRSVNISDTVPAGTQPTDPGTDPGTNPGTDPGTNPGTDPGTNPGTGSDPAIAEGLWDTSTSISTETLLASHEAMIVSPKVQVTSSGNVFVSWLKQSDPDATTLEPTQTDITIMRRTTDAADNLVWSDPSSAMFNPVGYNTAATDTQFVVNPVSGDGIATWNYNAATHTSEFMGGMGHFMGGTSIDEGHATKILSDSTGQVYLLAQAHMMGGFGLSVYQRTAPDTWSSTPIQLHRMDMADPYALVNHFLIATVDGQDNIRAIWLEEHVGVMALQTATYDATVASWGPVTEIQAHDVVLNRLASGIASGIPGSSDLQLVLYQQDGMAHAVFGAGYTEASGWSMPMRLDEPTSTSMMSMAPAFLANTAGHVLVAWVEKDSSMTASNTSGMMNMLMAKQYMPGMGWHPVEHITHASMMADVTALEVAISTTGEATATWVESSAMGSNIIASHKLSMGTPWTQKELIGHVPNADGSIQALATGLDINNVPIILWAVMQSDGVNDTFQIWRNGRLTAIADATGNGTDPGTDPGTNPGTDPGTDPGPGTSDPGAGGNDIPATVNWTTPVMASQMMHSASSFKFFGPQIVLDDIGGSSIRMAMKNRNGSSGTTVTTVHNEIVRSIDGTNWESILMGSGLMNDLSNTAILETINAVPTTGNLYGLIRDGETLYLARYLPDSGWGKLEIPGVNAYISRKNMQLTTNDTGMVTVVWHEPSAACCNVDIHAKHYMLVNGWQDTDTISVPAQSILMPHVVDSDGSVHVSWLVDNPDLSVGGFNMKMATYTPMVGWSETMDGPTGIRSGITKTTSSGTHKVVAVADVANNTIDAYVVDNSGNWTLHQNINQKVAGDNVGLVRHNDMQVVAGGSDHFMVAWREFGPDGNGGFEVRYSTALIHYMVDASTGMSMWHIENPSQVGGFNSEIESDLQFVLDSMGNAYAVWTSVDNAADTDNVYVNNAPMGSAWAETPELLASYDINAGNYAGHVSMAINSLGNIGIAWDQHMATSSMAMHNVWFVEKQ